jgi:hypothetical protein
VLGAASIFVFNFHFSQYKTPEQKTKAGMEYGAMTEPKESQVEHHVILLAAKLGDDTPAVPQNFVTLGNKNKLAHRAERVLFFSPHFM